MSGQCRSDEQEIRITVAHELGHHLLHEADHYLQCIESGPRDRGVYFVEREANNFAAELLIPEALGAQHCTVPLPPLEDVERLARLFKTSLEMRAIRFLERTSSPCAVARSMALTHATPEQIDIDLEFLKPFKASNKAVCKLVPGGTATRVSWTMSGTRNVLLAVMGKLFFDAMLAKDFDKGLAKLKAAAEGESPFDASLRARSKRTRRIFDALMVRAEAWEPRAMNEAARLRQLRDGSSDISVRERRGRESASPVRPWWSSSSRPISVIAMALGLLTTTGAPWSAPASSAEGAVALHVDASTAEARGVDWHWAMQLDRIGRGGEMRAVSTLSSSHDGDSARLAHDGGLREWYAVKGDGVEQGFDLQRRPDGVGPLRLELASRGMTPTLVGETVLLRDGANRVRARYGELAVLDAGKARVPAHLAVEGQTVSIEIDDAAARYPIAIDPTVIGAQVAEVATSEYAHALGVSAAYDGQTLISGTSNNGAFTFTRDGSSWTEQTHLVGDDSVSTDWAGASVAVSGDVAIVGARYAGSTAGAAYVFSAAGSGWTQSDKLASPTGTTKGYFGSAVAMDDTTLMISAPEDSHALGYGDVFVYARAGTTWAPTATLAAVDSTSLGESIALDGDTAVFGAPSGSTGGRAYVFARAGTAWTMQATLSSNATTPDEFGSTVAVSGDTVLVGAYADDGDVGAAYVFTRTGTAWSQEAKLTAPDGLPDDVFGISVAVDGDDALVGASHATGATGAAYSFHRTAGVWAFSALLRASDAESDAYFGVMVRIIDGEAFVGSTGAGVGLSRGSGAVYVFDPAGAYGDPCTAGGDCAGGACVDGVCCASSDCGTCGTCAGATPGTCAPKPLGAAPASSCALFACDGTSTACALACAGDSACVPGGKCDATTASCVAGAQCNADRTASYDTSGQSVSCGAYLCGEGGTCATSCDDSTVCQGGYVCASSACVASGDGSGGGKGGCAIVELGRGGAHDASGGAPFALCALLAGVLAHRGRRRGRRSSLRTATASIAIVAASFAFEGGVRAAPTVLGGQTAKLAPPGHSLGLRLAFDGTTIVAGSLGDNAGVGGAYFFSDGASGWGDPVRVDSSDAATLGYFGEYVGVSGPNAIISAPGTSSGAGAVYFFAESGSAWTQSQAIQDPGAAAGDDFGAGVGISATTAVVGASGSNDGAGAAYVYERAGSAWSLESTLQIDDPSLFAFGVPVDIDGDTLVAGSSPTTATDDGAIFVFVHAGTTWHQQGRLTVTGSPELGAALAISGDRIVAGAPFEDGSLGAAYVFARTGTTWSQEARLVAPDGEPGDAFGVSVAIDGDEVVIGAGYANDGAGSAYSFTVASGVWAYEATMRATDATAGSFFGGVVALHGDDAVIAAPRLIPAGTSNSGAVYVFTRAPANGDPCSVATDCASNACVDGVCCEATSCGTCGRCNGATPGTCTPKALGAAPTTSCGDFACSGSELVCSVACSGDAACVAGAHCNAATSLCEQGAYCAADRLGSFGTDGTETSCGAFLCGTGGTCATSCADSTDCAGGFVCTNGDTGASTCVAVSASGPKGGCSMTTVSPEGSSSGAIALALALASCALRGRRRDRSARPAHEMPVLQGDNDFSENRLSTRPAHNDDLAAYGLEGVLVECNLS